MVAARIGPGMTKILARTAADLAALPEGALVVTVNIAAPRGRETRRRQLWQRISGRWVHLAPARTLADGEDDGFLAELMTGFGDPDAIPGRAVVLDRGRPTHEFVLEMLPAGSIIRHSSGALLRAEPPGWVLLGAGSPPAMPGLVSSARLREDPRGHRVLFRPGDEG